MDLRELFDGVADGREPPTRLSAQSLYAAGRRRRRLRSLAGAGAVAALAVAVVVVLTTVLIGSRHTPVVPEPAAGDTAPSPVRRTGFDGVNWVSAADADHLFATVVKCRDPGKPPTCKSRLYGSDDGGRTWAPRSAAVTGSIKYVAGSTLVAWSHGSYQAGPLDLMVSTDAGRHWNKITMASTPVPSVPSGGFAMCLTNVVKHLPDCAVYAIDIVKRRAAPLSAQPALAQVYEPLGVESATEQIGSGILWVKGQATKGVSQFSMAVSTDRGRTWRTVTPGPGCDLLTFWRSDGPAAKVLCGGQNGFHLYATDDAGTSWREVALPPRFPNLNGRDEQGDRFAADGTLVAVQYPMDGSAVRHWILPDGASAWQKITSHGLPAEAQVVQLTPSGNFVAYAASGFRSFYISSDLSTWTRIAIP